MADAHYASLGLPLIHAGKVRELYALPGDDSRLLMVSTDNISAFDFVLDSLIPGKGIVLTQLSLWWFDRLAGIVANHVADTRVPEPVRGRAIVAEKLAMIPVECVARGYLTGSGWLEYQHSGTVCGIALPAGLHDGSKLPQPIFTPATKAPMGEHDENVSFEEMCATVGADDGAAIRDLSLRIYAHAEQIARARGIVLADTKFEFGKRPDGTIVLADEVLTPDSSRFWDARAYDEGRLESFDKQYVRNWLLNDSGWDRASGARPPSLPPSIVDATRARYLEAFERITGAAITV
ncbi:phosphoribosylaminoimidazole-succinocarboxamide synthase [Propionibacterium cyclohexanicum]|uniref:Phosphoribosylaminoimidazole-succinocarboxamide synthase n=1 Tax=Propionibacterium cyclohexanicum TaxID=64702 RepID=A0A1H9U5J8_9ACTN|nr:phosphoribosylaminoimidazolesuccinocarboxamide synthase [Propionibacterium cyclohexanicum]SES04602.1 phosphoribosylaminoimidazole-succinocarboxamide synthase [Propionibacterium cyclohexanicum]